MLIELPVPSLVLLVGVSGSGKSTFARRHFLPTEIISSDHCRALVCDDEDDQTVNKDAFELVHLIADKRLSHHKLTIIDATNVEPRARQSLLDLATRHQIPSIAIVLKPPVEDCVKRDAERYARVIGEHVILNQYAILRSNPLEGFSHIYWLNQAEEIEAVTIQRH